jgi:hypothetical protein
MQRRLRDPQLPDDLLNGNATLRLAEGKGNLRFREPLLDQSILSSRKTTS